MANRNKSAIIHIRVTEHTKRCLLALAGMKDRTETVCLTELIEAKACENLLNGRLGMLSIAEAVDLAGLPGCETLYQLRMYFASPTLLHKKQHARVQAVFDSPLYFSGRDQVFPDRPEIKDIPTFDLKSVKEHFPALSSYVTFLADNPTAKINYPEYRKLFNLD